MGVFRLFFLLMLAACHADAGMGPELCGCATPCNVTWTDYRYPTEGRLADNIGRSERCQEGRYTGEDDEDGFEGSRIKGAGGDPVTFAVDTPCQDLVDALLDATMDCGSEGTCNLKDAFVTPITCTVGATVDVEPLDPMTKFVDAMFALGVILAVPSTAFSIIGWGYCCRSSCCPPAASQRRWSQRTVMWLNLALGGVVFCCLLTSWIVDSKLRCQGGSHGGCGEDGYGGKVYDGDIFSVGAYVSGIAAFIAGVSIVTGFALCGAPQRPAVVLGIAVSAEGVKIPVVHISTVQVVEM
jgi:hypothetical protein